MMFILRLRVPRRIFSPTDNNALITYQATEATENRIPRYRTWNGSAWSDQGSMPTLTAHYAGLDQFILLLGRGTMRKSWLRFRMIDIWTLTFGPGVHSLVHLTQGKLVRSPLTPEVMMWSTRKLAVELC